MAELPVFVWYKVALLQKQRKEVGYGVLLKTHETYWQESQMHCQQRALLERGGN